MPKRVIIWCLPLVAVLLIAATSNDDRALTRALRANVQTVVVIYAENRSFDNLYGLFPGADGIPGVSPTSSGIFVPQKDRGPAGSVLEKLPQTWGGVTVPGQTPVITQAQSAGLPNQPIAMLTAFDQPLPQSTISRDLVHNFFENQMQIDGGSNDSFAAYSDAGGITMGYYDGSDMAMWKLAQQYVLADHFFMGAFGGSYINHQYLICACAPEYPDADTVAAHPAIAVLEQDGAGNYLPRLKLGENSPASALDGPPQYVNSGSIAPKNYFDDGKFHSVSTMFPPYQPSFISPPSEAQKLYADTARGITLPPQTQLTIGDALNAKHVSWKWYSGAWNQTLAASLSDRKFSRAAPGEGPNFQFHHQPFNYYAILDPIKHADARKEHLKDYEDLVADARAGKLPSVAFYKPQGNLNQHSGYASVKAGDEHIAQLIAELQKSPQWAHMVIVVTYDENGGYWDHVPPPHGDKLGPGTRIPALIISPFSKRGVVDHTPYDTGSIQRLITRRFGLKPLPGIVLRDRQVKEHGQPPLGDLTAALNFSK